MSAITRLFEKVTRVALRSADLPQEAPSSVLREPGFLSVTHLLLGSQPEARGEPPDDMAITAEPLDDRSQGVRMECSGNAATWLW